MKKITAFILALLASGMSFAQNTTTPKKNASPGQKTGNSFHQPAVGGVITDARSHPIPGAEAFIYQADSTIIASGYTDSTGHYETNSVLPGKYDVKIVYPSYKTILVKGVVIKSGITQLSFKANPPAADTTCLYTDLLPKPEAKKKNKK